MHLKTHMTMHVHLACASLLTHCCYFLIEIDNILWFDVSVNVKSDVGVCIIVSKNLCIGGPRTRE